MAHTHRTSLGRERLLRLGVPIEYHAQAKHYAGVMQGLGMAGPQIEAAIRFGAQFQGSPQELSAQFDSLCARSGITPDFASLSESWLDQINTRGFDRMPQVPVLPFTEADRARLVQIQAEMRKPRGNSDYWRDPAVRDEYQTLLERMEGGEGAAPPPSRHRDAGRKAELQALMRDRHSAYWREDSGLSAEYLAILEREGGAPGASVPSDQASPGAPHDTAGAVTPSTVTATEPHGATTHGA